MSAKEILSQLQYVNTLLSERINLHEYEKLPYHFQNYSIQNGRITFRVEDEFEVDLTIADEDPEKQFWMIDFRFLFKPAPATFKQHLRYAVENQVNGALEKDGLAGCYKVLHELTLTHKLSELRRQAHELARGRWIESLQVEALHRGVSIQYWKGRYGENESKSWVMLGPVSGKKKDAYNDEKATSKIGIRWFRDGKEIKDARIPLDTKTLNAEELIRSVVDLHVKHILKSMRDGLQTKPLYGDHELGIALSKSKTGEPQMHVQMTKKSIVTVLIEGVTGKFAISPASPQTMIAEAALNIQSSDPAAVGHEALAKLHSLIVMTETVSKAATVGWTPVKNPGLQQDELKHFMPKDTLQLSWFRKQGWTANWFLCLSSGASGESWWLIAVSEGDTARATGITSLDGPNVQYHIRVPSISRVLNPTYDFLGKMQIFASSIICFHANTLALHERKAQYALKTSGTKSEKANIQEQDAEAGKLKREVSEKVHKMLGNVKAPIFRIPDLYVPIVQLLEPPKSGGKLKTWARNLLQISFLGLERERSQETQVPLAIRNKTATPGTGLISPPPTQLLQPATSTPASSSQPQNQSQETRPQATATITPGGVEVVLVAKGHVLKPMPAGMLEKQGMTGDIAFNSATDGFAIRLQSKIGESVIEALTEQMSRVSRVVEVVQVVEAHKDTLECESVTMSRLQFKYGYLSAPDASGELKQTARQSAVIEWPDVEDSKAELSLEGGNPHIRILNYLKGILNSEVGLDCLVKILPLTLPVVRALDRIEGDWTTLGPQTNTEALVFSRSVDSFSIRYTLSMSDPYLGKTPEEEWAKKFVAKKMLSKHFTLELTMMERQGTPWWWVKRSYGDVHARTKGILPTKNDEVDQFLKEKAWTATVHGVWVGQQSSAIARVEGVEAMVLAVDKAVQEFAGSDLKTEWLTPKPVLSEEKPAEAAPAAKGNPPPKKEETPVMARTVSQQAQPTQPLVRPQPPQQAQTQPTLKNNAASMNLQLPPSKKQRQVATPQTQNQLTPQPQATPQQATPQPNRTPQLPQQAPQPHQKQTPQQLNRQQGQAPIPQAMPNAQMAQAPIAQMHAPPMQVSASMPGRPQPPGPSPIKGGPGVAGRGRGISTSPVMQRKVQMGGAQMQQPPGQMGVAPNMMQPGMGLGMIQQRIQPGQQGMQAMQIAQQMGQMQPGQQGVQGPQHPGLPPGQPGHQGIPPSFQAALQGRRLLTQQDLVGLTGPTLQQAQNTMRMQQQRVLMMRRQAQAQGLTPQQAQQLAQMRAQQQAMGQAQGQTQAQMQGHMQGQMRGGNGSGTNGGPDQPMVID